MSFVKSIMRVIGAPAGAAYITPLPPSVKPPKVGTSYRKKVPGARPSTRAWARARDIQGAAAG